MIALQPAVLRRLKARADAGLALAEPRQFPDAGPDRIDVGGDVNVDQIRLVGRNSLADSLTNIAGAVNTYAFDAAGAGHRREIRAVALTGDGIVEVGRQLPAAEI